MGCASTFIGIYKNGADEPIIGLCLGINGDGLILKYYNANTFEEEIAVGSDEVLTCCSGGFAERVKGMSCHSVLIGIFIDGDGEPIFAKFDGIRNGLAVLTYYNAWDGSPYNGMVYLCCTEADENTLYGETVTGVAGTTITMVNTGTAFTISWDNITHTYGWSQLGNVITLDTDILGGGEEIKIIYTI